MSTELIINASLPETRISLMEDGEIQDLLIERASGKGIVGNIYKGRVTRVLPGMQAAFVDIGLEKAAFLYVDDVFVHSHVWESDKDLAPADSEPGDAEESEVTGSHSISTQAEAGPASETHEPSSGELQGDPQDDQDDEDDEFGSEHDEDDGDDEEGEDDQGPVEMGPPPGEGEGGDGGGSDSDGPPAGTVSPQGAAGGGEGGAGGAEGDGRRRHRRGRRGGRFRKRRGTGPAGPNDKNEKNDDAESEGSPSLGASGGEEVPDEMEGQMGDHSTPYSDRAGVSAEGIAAEAEKANRPEGSEPRGGRNANSPERKAKTREEFKQQRGRDRRIPSKASQSAPRGQAKIEDLLKEGQEVIVQVAKDPISTKGARLTCHISLPGRHLVCMPTIDHVGVSRRIERDEERRRLRDFVERNRPKKLGFIVRTASGRQSSAEKRIKQDIDYLTNLWGQIRDRAAEVTAPAMIYEDLNSVLRAIRDWVTEDIDKIIVDSRYHYNEIQKFVSHFMPSLRQKVELYHGDIPIFDAYKISTELSRALERKVWLKSGGYIVVDQAEALVAIDVNTGRYVGKKNLEDTILKTNLEAVQEIAYQLRLRNCGGIIILDLIDMEKEENKQRVYRALEEAIKKDRARPTIMKISDLGLVEMTRKRTRDTIVRSLCESCNHCEGKGFIKSKQTVAYEVLREIEREGIDHQLNKVLVQANPDVIDILAIEERSTIDQLEKRYRKEIYLQAVGDYHIEQFEVSGDKPGGRPRALPIGRSSQSEDRSRGGGRGPRGGRDRGRGRDQDREKASGDRDRSSSGSSSEGIVKRPRIEIKPARIAQPLPGSPDGPGATPHFEDAHSPVNPGQPRTGEDFSEEDRLAFLRAQAAQDAALARLSNAGGNAAAAAGTRAPAAPRADRDRGGEGEKGAGGKRGRRGRRGGKNRRPPPGGAPRPLGAGESRGPEGAGGEAGGGDADQGGGEESADSGGPGDHSQPPV